MKYCLQEVPVEEIKLGTLILTDGPALRAVTGTTVVMGSVESPPRIFRLHFEGRSVHLHNEGTLILTAVPA